MPLTEHDHHLIEQYLLNRLSETEQSEFEQRSKDSDFRAELAIQRDIIAAFQSSGRDELKAGLQDLESEIQRETPIRKIRTMSRWWLVAASVAVLLTLFLWLFPSGPSNQELFTQYFEPYPNIVAPIEKGVRETDRQKIPYQQYERKDYDVAISMFSDWVTSSDTSKFYLALAMIGHGNHNQPVTDLLDQIEEPSIFAKPAQWYKALVLLKNNETQEAKELLQNIQQDAASPFSAKAKELLSSLN